MARAASKGELMMDGKEGRKKLHPRPAPKAEDGKRTYQDRPKQQHKALTLRCIAMSVVSLKRHGHKGGDPNQVSLPHERQTCTRTTE
jgi:hypothetical protein